MVERVGKTSLAGRMGGFRCEWNGGGGGGGTEGLCIISSSTGPEDSLMAVSSSPSSVSSLPSVVLVDDGYSQLISPVDRC
jgi:hypothetical protein